MCSGKASVSTMALTPGEFVLQLLEESVTISAMFVWLCHCVIVCLCNVLVCTIIDVKVLEYSLNSGPGVSHVSPHWYTSGKEWEVSISV